MKSRICFLWMVGWGFLSLQWEGIPGSLGAASECPNILLIMADDLGIDGLSCYGSDSYATPRLDRMADEGLRFTHAYAQPLCTPTRVQLMTGRYNHRNWVAFGILDPRERTFGHLMRSAGYRTVMAGKWQLHSYDPPDFPNAEKRRGLGMKVADSGFEAWSLYHAWETENKGSRYANPSMDRNGKPVGPLEGEYGPDTSVRFLLDFFQQHREEPVFAYYAMSLPHWPMVPTPDSEEWKNPSLRLKEGVEHFPDMVSYTDKVVGQLLDGLQALKLHQRTLVLFYSDNGTDARIESVLQGRTYRGGKATPAQTGIRVPLIARWPGTLPAGRQTDILVDASDFFPTLAELAGVPLPKTPALDGRSFAPLLQGEETLKDPRKSCFFWYDPRPGWDKERFSRHVFALDHGYKLFQDGRFFDIRGEGYREVHLTGTLGPEAMQARQRLQEVLDRKLQPPTSEAAQRLVDAYGNPLPNTEAR